MLKIKTTVEKALTTVADLPNVKAALALVKADLSKDGQHYLRYTFDLFNLTYSWGLEPLSFELQGFGGSDRFTECWNVRVDFTAYDLIRFYKGYFYITVFRADVSDELVWKLDTSKSSYDGRQYFKVGVFTQSSEMEG